MVKLNSRNAGYGLNSWLQQWVTAVIMLLLVIAFLGFIAFIELKAHSDISSIQSIFNNIIIKILTHIFFASVALHAWIGMRDFWMDYIKCVKLRLTLHIMSLLWLLGSLIYSIKIIW